MGDLVFEGSCAGVFYAFDRRTGSVIWAHDTAADGEAGNFHGNPLIAGAQIITGVDAPNLGHLYAFRRADGTLLWKREMGRGVPTDILRHGDHLLAITLSGQVICLELESGEPAWTVPPPEDGPFLRSSLLIRKERVFVAVGSTLRALDVSTGETLWEFDAGSRANTSLAYLDGSLYVGTMDHVLLRLDPDDGNVLSAHPTDGMPYGALTPVEGGLLVLLDPGRLVRMDPGLTATKWETTAGEWSSFRPLRVKDVVLVGSSEGEVRAVRIDDGTLAWNTHVQGVVRGLGFAEGIYYIGTLDGMLLAYRREP